MASCRGCRRDIFAINLNNLGYCSQCRDAAGEKYRAAREEFDTRGLSALVDRVVPGVRWRAIGVGFSDVMDRQTLMRTMGQAFTSGVIGLSAPFLVRNSDLVGKLTVVGVGDSTVFLMKYGLVSLGGTVSQPTLASGDFVEFIAEDVRPEIVSYPCSAVNAKSESPKLIISGEIQLSLSVKAHPAMPGSDAGELAQVINHADYVTPFELAHCLRNGETNAPQGIRAQLAENSKFREELLAEIKKMPVEDRRRAFQALTTLGSNIASIFGELVSRRARRATLCGRAALVLALVAIAAVCLAIREIEIRKIFLTIGIVGGLGCFLALIEWAGVEWYRAHAREWVIMSKR
jgi:hypothetical protein